MNCGALATGKRWILIRCAEHHPQGEAFWALPRQRNHTQKNRPNRGGFLYVRI